MFHKNAMIAPLNRVTTKLPERRSRTTKRRGRRRRRTINMESTTRRSITRTINRSKTRTKRRTRTREKVKMRFRLKVGMRRESKSMTPAATENTAAVVTTTTTTTTALNINLSRWFALKVAKRGGSSMMKPLLVLPLLPLLLLSSLAGQQVVSAHKSIPIANAVWDFGMPHAPPTSSKAGLSSAPAFAIEPPSLVEYSNSTGTVIACRPQVSSTTPTMNNMMAIMMTNPTTITSNQEPIGSVGGSKAGGASLKQDFISDQQSRLASNTPTAISWRLVKRLPSQLNVGIRERVEGGGGDDSSAKMTTTTTTIQQPEDLALPLNSSSRLYFVRQDGALVFNPFKAVDFRHDLHLATYKCCLSNRYGSICSRPVRTRAVLDTNFNVEVFDEFALAQNSITLNCQVQPTYVAKFVQVIAWLRNDKILITSEQSRQQISTNSYLSNKKQQQINNNYAAQNQNKYIILETGELFIRNVSKQYDSGTYKCRVRYKLTNISVTSKIGAQLMVDDSKTKTSSELKLVNEPNRQQLVWRQENSDAFVCANIQSIPVASFTWFKQNLDSNERQLISELNWPDIRQLDSCIYIQQLQQKHTADYICEANNGESSSRSTTSRLIVTSSHLTAQVQLIQAHQLVRGNGGLMPPTMSPAIRATQTMSQAAQLQYQSTVQFGSNIYLNCSISGFPFDTIAWYKDTKLIAVSSYYPFQMQTTTDQIHLIDAKKRSMTDEPTTTTTTTTTPTSAKITNRLFSNIKLVQETVILIENFGLKDRGVYQCQVYSAQANSLPLNLSQIATKSQLLNQKLFTNGFEQHQVGSNEFQLERDFLRSASGSIQLEIAFSKPIISHKFSSQSVQHGGQLSLQCVVFGLPAPHILWFLDNSLISSSLSSSANSAQTSIKNTYSTYLNSLNDNDGLLVVGEEEGEEVIGKKGNSKEEKEQNLDEEAEFKFRDIKALEISNLLWNNDIQATTLNSQQYSADVDEISNLPPSLNVIEDERFQVKTHFISSESGKATNFLNYHQKAIEEKYHQQQPMLLSELNVSQLSVSETGQYKCLAINPLGSNQHIGQVNVVSTTNTQELELRSYQATNVTLIAGKSSTLHCPLIGYPLSRVDWFRDGQRLPINRRQRIEPIKFGFGGQLELTNVDKLSDGGIYTCRVSLAQKSALPPSNSSNGSNLEITEQQEREHHHHHHQQQQQQESNTNQDKQQFNRGGNEAGGSNFVQQDDLVGQIQAIVRVAPLIDSESLPEIKQANEGMTIQLVCSVIQGDRPVRINWLKRVGDKSKIAFVGGSQLAGFELMKNSILQSETEEEKDETIKGQVSKNKQSFERDNSEDSFNGLWLTFKQISYTDSGDYVCLVQNDVGQSMRLTRVIVNVAPSWSNELSSDVSVLLGDRLQLDCLAHGFPQPHVTWRREIKSKQTYSPPNELVISQQSQTDSFKDIKDSQSNEFTNIISNYHTRAYLNGSLIIDQVDQSDGGIFMCEVGNGIGTGLSRVVHVKVNVPPYFKHRSTTYLGQLGTKAELKCIAFGDYPMLIGWRKDSDIIDLVNDNRHRLVREHKLAQQSFESILTIDNLTRLDSGQYMCIASNEYGSEEMRIQLIVQEPPEEPVLMRPIRATSRQATLTLRPPYTGNSQIKKYAITFKQTDFSDDNNQSSNFVKFDQMINWQQILIDAPQQQQSSQDQLSPITTAIPTFLSPIKSISNESSIISSSSLSINSFSFSNSNNNNNQQLVSLNLCCLQPFTRYLVRVKAINEIGASEPSKPIQFMTDEEVIGGPPLDVNVEATGAHSLKVRWRSPARNLQNGLIRGYYIGYRATNLPASPTSNLAASNNLMLGENNNLKANHQSISSPNIKVFELMESEQYQYKNVQLDMNALNLRQFNLNIPELVQDSASPFSSNNNKNSLQTSIIAQTSSQSQPQVFTSYLTNLRRKTAYSIIVQAYNKIGAGPRSDSITVSTLDAAPPMSPILKLISTSLNSAQLIWSSRKFDNNNNNNNNNSNNNHENNNFSSRAQQSGSTTRLFNFEESLEEDEDDDPQSYYTINFKTLDEKSAQIANDGGQTDDWQQRRVQKRQQLPYVLTSLKCGSHYAAFMTATNSLGQSEPGETIKLTTLGAAPIAASNSKDFLHVNSTYIILHLNLWQNAGCIINSFTFKFKSVNQVKWNILEHQVHPTIQTVTVAGSAVFSVQNSPETSYLVNEQTHHQQQQQQQQQYPETWMSSSSFDNKQRQVFQGSSMLANKQQTFSDFVLRNLLPNAMYKLIVEANSEAGMTTAEYEFETSNFTTSTISITVNGINADNSIFSMQNKNGRVGFESSDLGELDFSYSGGQRALNPFQRYNFGVWSLTALFVIASIFMAITTLILGFRSIIKMKSISNSRDSLLSAIFCCSNSSSSSSGADSSHSSSAGTCYQVSDHPIDPYYTLSNHCLMLSSDLTPTRARLNGGASTISGHLDSCDGGELKSIMGDPLPFRQMVSSSSLSTIGGRYNQQQRQQQQQQQQQHLDDQQVRRTHTLGSAAHCQAVARKFNNDELSQNVNHIKAHYAATLGKQQSTFMQTNNQQPIKYNDNNDTNHQSPLYGRLQTKPGLPNNADFENQQQLLYSTNNDSSADNYQHFQHPLSSSGTSGYDTNNSIKVGSDVDRQSQPIYMQGGNPVVAAAAAATAYQMNMYGANISNGIVEVNNNLFEQDANLNGLNREQNQGQFHHNVPGDVSRNISCQQQQQLADAAVYGIIYGNNQQVILGQNESAMKQLDQQQQQQFEQQSQELNHHLALLANSQQQNN